MDDLKLFIPFTKKDQDKRVVSGYASTEALDSDGEIVERGAIIKALPGYLGDFNQKDKRFRFGNIREMHQPSAVGKTMKAKVDKKGLFIDAKVVDDNAWNKVKEGVYAGFSVGGKIVHAVKNRIKSIRLSEISLVDRPANPEAIFAMVKINKSGKAVDLQKGSCSVEIPHEEVLAAGAVIDLAREIRMFINIFEVEGRSTIELEKALNLLKKLAAKILNEKDKKKFEKVLYEVRHEEIEKLLKRKLTTTERKKIPAGKFAYIDSKGGKHLPIQDKAHVRNAMARFNQTHFESPAKKKSAARKIIVAARKFGIKVSSNSAVAQAASKFIKTTGEIKKHINKNWTPGYFDNLRKALG